MKPSILILVLAGLLAGAPASFGQAPASTSPSHQRFNLNGVWQSHTPDGQPFTYRFEQQGNQFHAIFGGAIPQSNDFLGFEGQYQGDAIAGRRLTRIAWKGQPAQWTEQTLIVDDPDHAHFTDRPEIVRISPPRSDDAVCDGENSSRTKADFAWARAIYAANHNAPTSIQACWAQISAMQGNPRAQDAFALFLRDGDGVPKNPAAALSWAQKSAAQKDTFGEQLLAQMYRDGIGTAANPSLARYWDNQARQDSVSRQQRQESASAQNQLQQDWQRMLGMAIGAAVLNSFSGSSSSSDYEKDQAQQQQDYEERMRQEARDKEIEDQINKDCHKYGSLVCE